MRNFWKVFRRWWWVPFVVLGGILAWILLARFLRPQAPGLLDGLQKELEIINAGAEVDRVYVELGYQEALNHVREKYTARRAKLTAKQQERAAKLEKDPEALARFIVRGTEP